MVVDGVQLGDALQVEAGHEEVGEEEELGQPLVRPEEEDPGGQGKVDVAVRVVAIESPCIIPSSLSSEHPELGLDPEEVVELDLLARRVDKVLLDVDAQRRLPVEGAAGGGRAEEGLVSQELSTKNKEGKQKNEI